MERDYAIHRAAGSPAPQVKRSVKVDRVMTETLGFDQNGIDRATQILRAGELVAFPTETVYGLGGDARNDLAVAKIFAA